MEYHSVEKSYKKSPDSSGLNPKLRFLAKQVSMCLKCRIFTTVGFFPKKSKSVKILVKYKIFATKIQIRHFA